MPVFKRSKKAKEQAAPRPAQELMQGEDAALPKENIEQMVESSEYIVPAPKDIMLSVGVNEDMGHESAEEIVDVSLDEVAMPDLAEDLSDQADNSFPTLDEPLLDPALQEAIEQSEAVVAEDAADAEDVAEVDEPDGIQAKEQQFENDNDLAPNGVAANELDSEIEQASLEALEEVTEHQSAINNLEETVNDLEERLAEKTLALEALQEANRDLEQANHQLKEEGQETESSLVELEALRQAAHEKEEIAAARIVALEEQIEELAQTEDSEEVEKEKEAALRRRIEGLLEEITPAGAQDPDFTKLNTLLQSVEEYHDYARVEKERIETLHSLAEMELQRAREQTIEADKSKSALEKEREEIASLRSDLEREQEVLQAEKENLQVDRVEVTRTLSGARERERRTEQELINAQEARDKADAGRREIELLERRLEISQEELNSRMQKLEEEERRLEAREKNVQEQNGIAEEQRKYSLEILENVTEMRRSLERSRAEVESQQEHLRQERDYYEGERIKTEKKKEEYEKGIEELTASREGVVDELERARQTREEAEREREVLSEELRVKIYSAGEETRQVKEELSRLRDSLEEAERNLSQSEGERHELRAEVQRLTGMVEDGSLGKEEARELRQWVSRSRQLEEELQDLRSRAPIPEDVVALAQDAIQDLGDAVMNIKGGDPDKRAQLQKLLTDLMDVATGNDNLVQKTVQRAQVLISELEAEGALPSAASVDSDTRLGEDVSLSSSEPASPVLSTPHPEPTAPRESDVSAGAASFPDGINAEPVASYQNREETPTSEGQSEAPAADESASRPDEDSGDVLPEASAPEPIPGVESSSWPEENG